MAQSNWKTSFIAALSAVAGGFIGSFVAGYFTLEAAKTTSASTIAAAKETARAQAALKIAEQKKEKAVPFYVALSAIPRTVVMGAKDFQGLRLAWAELDLRAAELTPYLDYSQMTRVTQIVEGYRLVIFEPEQAKSEEARRVFSLAMRDFDIAFHSDNDRLEFSAQSSPDDQERLFKIKQRVWDEYLYPERPQDDQQYGGK